jgi:hypothetical protein
MTDGFKVNTDKYPIGLTVQTGAQSPFSMRAVTNADQTACQVCHRTTDDPHWGGVGSMGEELFFCLDHCPKCAHPHPRYVSELRGWLV